MPPTRSISPSWIARSSLACRSSRRSPISSRNSVPPSAISNLPSCCRTAPVKAPFSWPKSVLSTSSDGTAARLTGMNGAVGVRRLVVQAPRDHLLAGAALALHQHRGVELGDLAHQVHDVAHHRARAGDEVADAVLVGDLRRQRLDLAAEVLLLAGVAHQRAQRVVLEVLGDEVVGALLDRLDGGLDLADRRDDDDLDARVLLLGRSAARRGRRCSGRRTSSSIRSTSTRASVSRPASPVAAVSTV